MLPQTEFLTIHDNEALIRQFIEQVIIQPKMTLKHWSEVTNQTPAVKLGYIGQHLASLITGVRGTGSGARGDDLEDGSEVKSCNKIDQADKCKNKDCGRRVMRYENVCPYCGCTDIERKDDSKWLFTVRSKEELQQYLNMDRVVLLLMDYPNFDNNDFRDIRISVFEIYPKEERMKVFGQLLSNFYHNIYKPKLADKIGKTNPMNLHPLGFQFYKCNPIKTFECIIKDIDTHPDIQILHYFTPEFDRSADVPSEAMPTSSLLTNDEMNALCNNAPFKLIKPLIGGSITKEEFCALTANDKRKMLPLIPEALKVYIPLRPITPTRQKNPYKRS